ncbi:MAG: Acetylornithine deacetylase or succinyl-diaminopimelate desuccinylase [Microgenomates group bacterium GW2011_GWA1_Microgenomates_45_10]|nr:MAG: Acetylornithine deacetylase or succinyl-diaminopimelate desuccinylase [Microgenomates group bacterium GW2011_GWA1_Microgenomates_45_10]
MKSLSPIQQAVLHHFAQFRTERFYLRELARVLAQDPGNLSRVLKSLTTKGYLEKAQEGNLTYFSLRPEENVNSFGLKIDNARLRAYLKEREPEIVKFAQNLIRTPSVSGVDPEQKIAALIYGRATQLGLYPRQVAKDRSRPNLVIDLDEKPTGSKSYFLLVGHMDTIGTGEIDNWDYYPFSGHVAGGNLYGRGAIDMKAGIACELYTLKAIKDLNLQLPVEPRILLVSNEEGGSTATPIFDLGMEHLIHEGLVEGVAAIYGYGGTYNVGIGHRGVLRMAIATKGEAVHTGSLKWQQKEKGINAVTAMAEILLALENLELPKTEHPSFVKHGNVITPGTMILHGGTAVSTVPDYCESVVDIRYLPGVEIDKVEQQVREIAEEIAKRRGVRVELRSFVNISAVSLSPSEKIVEVVSSSAEQVYGQKISARGTGPANESFMLIKRGIPTVVFGPLGNGAHADNECVNVSSLTKTIEVYLQTMSRFI